MSTETTLQSQPPSSTRRAELKHEYLSFWEVLAQSVANIAPSATPALIIPLVFARSGNSTWMVYVFATVAMLLVGYQINVFARRSSSPGSLYIYVSQGLGSTWGVICGWSLVIAYLFTGAAVLAGAANYMTVLSRPLLGQQFDLAVAAFSMVAVVSSSWWLAYKDVKLSTRMMLWLEFTSVALILFLACAFFWKSGKIFDAAQFSFSGATASTIRQGLVLAVFSYVGFESATVLGHEAKDPLHSIPRSVLMTVIAVGGLFVFMSYVLVFAFRGAASPLAESNAPLSVLAEIATIPSFGYAIAVGAAISFFACALASINAAARVLFAMSRHGLVHLSAGNAHKEHNTPHIAVAASSLIVLVAPLSLLVRHVEVTHIFDYLGSIATFGFLFAYALISVAGPFYLYRRSELSPIAIAVAILALFLIALPIVGSVYPVPDPPTRYLPLVFLGLLGLGTARFLYLRVTQPELMQQIEEDLLKG